MTTDVGEPILSVRGLTTSFYTRAGVIRAVTGVDFDVRRGEVLGIVGESGCGKSVTSLTILGLVGAPGRVEGGEVLFHGRDLLKLSADEMRKIRGDQIAMIFQQPQSSLNPVMKVGLQIAEALRVHTDLGESACQVSARWSSWIWSASPTARHATTHTPTRCRAEWRNA